MKTSSLLISFWYFIYYDSSHAMISFCLPEMRFRIDAYKFIHFTKIHLVNFIRFPTESMRKRMVGHFPVCYSCEYNMLHKLTAYCLLCTYVARWPYLYNTNKTELSRISLAAQLHAVLPNLPNKIPDFIISMVVETLYKCIAYMYVVYI